MLAWLAVIFFAAVACMGCGAMLFLDPVGAYIAALALVGIGAALAATRRNR